MTEQFMKAKAFIEQYFQNVRHLKKDPVTHAVEVVRILQEEFGLEENDLLVAGILHDVLEDTQIVTVEMLAKEFSPRIASLVEAVSHDRGPNYDREAFYERLATIPTEAKWLKLADLYANLEWMLLHVQEGTPILKNHSPYLRHARMFIATCTDPRITAAAKRVASFCTSIEKAEKDSSYLETILVHGEDV